MLQSLAQQSLNTSINCCSLCAASQLASQTADYDVIRAECCSKTGLPEVVNTGEIYAQTGMVWI